LGIEEIVSALMEWSLTTGLLDVKISSGMPPGTFADISMPARIGYAKMIPRINSKEENP
jgi:hypothetical protein